MNIVLCGMMGVGKTSVGISLAGKTNRCWYDTDDLITGKYGRISDIFEYYGEPHFRNLETQTIKELVNQDFLVISTGGGAVLKRENVDLLKGNGGKIVYLRAKSETLLKRISPEDDSRPLLAKHSVDGMKAKIESLLFTRSSIYETVADFVVDTDDKTVSQVADEIIALIGNAQ